MPSYFCLSVQFLQPYYHGRKDGGEPEWPPSPLRVFQSLVAAAATRWRETGFQETAVPALRWLERQNAPGLAAAVGQVAGAKYRLYVPDNVADKVANSWSGGREASIADYRTEKDVRPMNLRNGDAVHYLFPLSDDKCPHFDVLVTAARSITHLGWGVDMVAGNAAILSDEEADNLPGERWLSVEETTADRFRAPVEGTLDALLKKHKAFLNRVGPEGFIPVPPLSTFRVIGYRRVSDPSPRQFAAFSLLKPDASGMRTFDPVRRTRDVAGMMRHAVADLAIRFGWSAEQVNVFVHGKTPDGQHPSSGEKTPDRFMYLPLPTINHALRRVESIRRVLVAAPAHCREQIAWVRRALSGEELKNDAGEATALATILPRSDWVLGQYIKPSRLWATVTPVILPGHDDRDSEKAGKLFRTALAHAGYQKELIGQIEIEWRGVGFHAGVNLASRYVPPKNLDNRPRYHVRLRFPHPIAGPVVVGSGRFRGFGLFTSMEDR